MMAGTMIPPQFSAGSNSNIGTATGTLFFLPLYVPRRTTFLGLKCRNAGTGDSGDKARMGVYRQSDSGMAGALVVDAGEVTCSGSAAVLTAVSSFTVEEGLSWLAITLNATIDINTNRASAYQSTVGTYPNTQLTFFPVFTFPSNARPDVNLSPYYSASHVYGALPDPAPAFTANVTDCPIVVPYA
jgi:hypothetical protein